MGDAPSSLYYHPIDTTPHTQLSEVMGLLFGHGSLRGQSEWGIVGRSLALDLTQT